MVGRLFMVSLSAYMLAALIGAITFAIRTPVCWRGATRLDCIADMPLWFGWIWRAMAGWGL